MKRNKVDLSFLKGVLPKNFTRRQIVELLKEHYPIKLSVKTLQNLDSNGSGVKGRIVTGGTTIYTRDNFISFLENRTKILA